MKIGDLVIGKGFEFRNHGVGIIIHSRPKGKCRVLKVYWPKKAVWCYTGTGGVKPL